MQFDQKIRNLIAKYYVLYRLSENNIVFRKNDRGFKKYQLHKKFIYRQLISKIGNFDDIRQNNSVFT